MVFKTSHSCSGVSTQSNHEYWCFVSSLSICGVLKHSCRMNDSNRQFKYLGFQNTTARHKLACKRYHKRTKHAPTYVHFQYLGHVSSSNLWQCVCLPTKQQQSATPLVVWLHSCTKSCPVQFQWLSQLVSWPTSTVCAGRITRLTKHSRLAGNLIWPSAFQQHGI